MAEMLLGSFGKLLLQPRKVDHTDDTSLIGCEPGSELAGRNSLEGFLHGDLGGQQLGLFGNIPA